MVVMVEEGNEMEFDEDNNSSESILPEPKPSIIVHKRKTKQQEKLIQKPEIYYAS